MSRKPPSDTFTRFTSNPTSFSSQPPQQPSFTSSQPQPQPSQNTSPSQPEPPTSTETPQERVARLRAAHRARLASQLSTSDRLLTHGRSIADILHRGTTYTLLGFSVLATVVAAYGLVSLVSHNRTQKRAWIEREMDRLADAQRAFLNGTADAEQLHLLEQERAGEELKKRYESDKKAKKEAGYFSTLKGLFRSGDLGKDADQPTLQERGRQLRTVSEEQEERNRTFVTRQGEMELRPAAVQESSVPGVGLDEKGRPVPLGKMERMRVQSGSGNTDSPVLSAMQAATRQRQPGELDVLADNISRTGNGWLSSIFGGASKS